jgi:hypothetical protein
MLLHCVPAQVWQIELPLYLRSASSAYYFPGKRESSESLERLWAGGFGSIPERILSNSELKRIQSFTRITKCGVLSLKKNLERNSRNKTGEIGYPFSSMMTAVLFASGEKMSRTQPDMLLYEKRCRISVAVVFLMRL